MYEALRKFAEESYPHECCGAMIGELRDGERRVHELVPCRNSRQDSPENRYGIEPKELVAAQRRAREMGMDLVGFYHSHPNSAARWSQHDLEEAHWFACSYVITSVEGGIASRTHSYVLAGTDEDDKRFDDETIELVDE
jgi:proteasome lid subunit RPN8/RPN11